METAMDCQHEGHDEGQEELPLILTPQDLSWLRKLKLSRTMVGYKLPNGTLSRLKLGFLIGHPEVEKASVREYAITPKGRDLLDWLDDPANQDQKQRLNGFPGQLRLPLPAETLVTASMYMGSQTSPLNAMGDQAARSGAKSGETGCE